MKEKTVLVVDDDKAILESLVKVLESEGYKVDTAETGQEAISKSTAKFFNAALLDIKLPDMEGTKLLRALSEATPKMVKIMVTGYPDLDNAIISLNWGADAYLLKPINPTEMLKVIEEKLKEQEDNEKMYDEKVKRWIETRIKKLDKSA